MDSAISSSRSSAKSGARARAAPWEWRRSPTTFPSRSKRSSRSPVSSRFSVLSSRLERRDPESLNQQLQCELADSRGRRIVVERAVSEHTDAALGSDTSTLRDVQVGVSHEETLNLPFAEVGRVLARLRRIEIELRI